MPGVTTFGATSDSLTHHKTLIQVTQEAHEKLQKENQERDAFSLLDEMSMQKIMENIRFQDQQEREERKRLLDTSSAKAEQTLAKFAELKDQEALTRQLMEIMQSVDDFLRIFKEELKSLFEIYNQIIANLAPHIQAAADALDTARNNLRQGLQEAIRTELNIGLAADVTNGEEREGVVNELAVRVVPIMMERLEGQTPVNLQTALEHAQPAIQAVLREREQSELLVSTVTTCIQAQVISKEPIQTQFVEMNKARAHQTTFEAIKGSRDEMESRVAEMTNIFNQFLSNPNSQQAKQLQDMIVSCRASLMQMHEIVVDPLQRRSQSSAPIHTPSPRSPR